MQKPQTNVLSTVAKRIACSALYCISLLSAPAFAQPMQGKADTQHIQQCLLTAAAKYNFPPALLFAIAEQESGFNPKAVGYTGIAFGLMQIYWTVHRDALTARGIGFKDLFDPCVSANEGARILHGFMAQHGASWKAVGAYYAGNKFSKETDRRWYAHQIARRFDYYTKNGARIANTSSSARYMASSKLVQGAHASTETVIASNMQDSGGGGIWEAN